jgi:hypothetical protein
MMSVLSAFIIGVANDHLWFLMDPGFVHERDAHAPAREWPDQLQKAAWGHTDRGYADGRAPVYNSAVRGHRRHGTAPPLCLFEREMLVQEIRRKDRTEHPDRV